MLKRVSTSAALLFILAGCGGGDNDVALLTTTTAPPTEAVVVLNGDGLDIKDEKVAFGDSQADASAKANEALGKPEVASENCPEGGFDYIENTYGSVTMLFSEGKFAGWRTDNEAYDTPEGAHIGSTSDFMLEAYSDFQIDRESTIGTEWFTKDYRGTLDEETQEEVASMSAGLVCIVR